VTDEFDEKTSDIDFLVQFDKSINPNRFDNFFALLDELKKLFGRDVDLVEPGGLRNPYLIQKVNQTKRKVYAAS
jgi:predicted nucleotidyltransferase